MLVRFNSVEEFCDELRKEKGNIQRRIVRVTNLYIPTRLTPNIQYVSVLSTFIAGPFLDAAPRAGETIVRLEHHCGDIWSRGGTDVEALKKAEEVTKTIEKVCQELGLDVRSGVIDLGEKGDD